MKQWKKNKKRSDMHLDIGTRDAPCIIIGDRLIIGKYHDSHGYLIQTILYGIHNDEEEETDMNVYDKRYFGDDAPMIAKRSEIYDDFDDNEVLYGNLIGKNIFWDDITEKVDTSTMLDMINKTKSLDYNHYRLNCIEDKGVILLKRRGKNVKTY